MRCIFIILQLIEAQHQISQYKQRCEELSAQLSSLSTADTVPTAIYDKLTQVCVCDVCTQTLNLSRYYYFNYCIIGYQCLHIGLL